MNNQTTHFFSFLCTVPSPTPFITQSTPLTAGDSGTLSCNYTGYTGLSRAVDVKSSVTWTVNRSVVDTSSGDGRISTNGLSLIFSPVTTADSGSYTCTLRLTSNTPHVTIIDGRQESSVTAITVLSMSTQLHTYVCYYHTLSLSQSPHQLCQSLSIALVHCLLVLSSPSPVL